MRPSVNSQAIGIFDHRLAGSQKLDFMFIAAYHRGDGCAGHLSQDLEANKRGFRFEF